MWHFNPTRQKIIIIANIGYLRLHIPIITNTLCGNFCGNDGSFGDTFTSKRTPINCLPLEGSQRGWSTIVSLPILQSKPDGIMSAVRNGAVNSTIVRLLDGPAVVWWSVVDWCCGGFGAHTWRKEWATFSRTAASGATTGIYVARGDDAILFLAEYLVWTLDQVSLKGYYKTKRTKWGQFRQHLPMTRINVIKYITQV